MDKKSKLFLAFSVLFLTFMVVFFGYRFIHFYRLEHPQTSINKKKILSETLKKEKKVTTGDGLYQEQNMSYYKGNVTNNYVSYHGLIWRIVSFDEDTITLIPDNIIGSLVWGYQESDYQHSYIHEWLMDNEQGVFQKNMKFTSLAQVDEPITLLTENQYTMIGGENSYLNIGKYWWLQDSNEDYKVRFVTASGSVSDDSKDGSTYYSYGIRPIVQFQDNLLYYSGNGSKEYPYVIEEITTNQLKDKAVGTYVNYSNYRWRIIGKEQDMVKVVLDGTLKDDGNDIFRMFSEYTTDYNIEEETNIGYYLNHDFYNQLNHPEYIKEGIWEIGSYNASHQYDFKALNQKTTTANIGLLSVSDLFTTDYADYFLLTSLHHQEESIYKVLPEGRYYADYMMSNSKVRPALYLDGNLTVKGSGDNMNPWEIEG